MAAYGTTYELGTDIGKVRLSIGDTTVRENDTGILPNGAHYTDAELQTFIDMVGGNWRRAVPIILRAASAKWATQAQEIEVEEYRESFARTADLLLTNATAFEKQIDAIEIVSGATSYADMFGFEEGPRFFGTRQFGAQIRDVARDDA